MQGLENLWGLLFLYLCLSSYGHVSKRSGNNSLTYSSLSFNLPLFPVIVMSSTILFSNE